MGYLILLIPIRPLGLNPELLRNQDEIIDFLFINVVTSVHLKLTIIQNLINQPAQRHPMNYWVFVLSINLHLTNHRRSMLVQIDQLSFPSNRKRGTIT